MMFFKKPKLTIELVPKTSWYSNVRKNVSRRDWDIIRKRIYRKAGYRCEICSGRGDKWPVECHEVWEYNDRKKIQKLVGMVALCPMCHSTKHYGLSTIQGIEEEVKEHIMKVNEWDLKTTNSYIKICFKMWEVRSDYNWDIDFSFLTGHYGITEKDLGY